MSCACASRLRPARATAAPPCLPSNALRPLSTCGQAAGCDTNVYLHKNARGLKARPSAGRGGTTCRASRAASLLMFRWHRALQGRPACVTLMACCCARTRPFPLRRRVARPPACPLPLPPAAASHESLVPRPPAAPRKDRGGCGAGVGRQLPEQPGRRCRAAKLPRMHLAGTLRTANADRCCWRVCPSPLCAVRRGADGDVPRGQGHAAAAGRAGGRPPGAPAAAAGGAQPALADQQRARMGGAHAAGAGDAAHRRRRWDGGGAGMGGWRVRWRCMHVCLFPLVCPHPRVHLSGSPAAPSRALQLLSLLFPPACLWTQPRLLCAPPAWQALRRRRRAPCSCCPWLPAAPPTCSRCCRAGRRT